MDSGALPRRIGKIKEAYCYETNSIDKPYVAHQKRARMGKMHYFCSSPNCGYPIKTVKHEVSKKGEIAYFVSADIPTGARHSHELGCPYQEEKTQTTGTSGNAAPQDDFTTLATPFIPGTIVDPALNRPKLWPGKAPSRPLLLSLIGSAKSKPGIGTIEDVMVAHQIMMAEHFEHLNRQKNKLPQIPPIFERSGSKLIISDNETDYMHGILSLKFLKQPLIALTQKTFLERHIICFAGIPQRYPNQKHAYTLTPLPKGTEFPLWLDTRVIAGDAMKSYIEPLFEEQCTKKGLILCYLWNIEPVVRPDSGKTYWWIDNRNDFMRAAFVVAPNIR